MSGMWLYPYFLLVLSFMGMTSNMASIFVFAKQRFRRSFHRLLVILAIYDFMVVTLCAMLWSLPQIWPYYKAYIFPYWSSVLLPMVQITLMSSVYTTIIMSWERYVRICMVSKIGCNYFSEGRFKMYLFFIILFPIIFYIPKFFELMPVVIHSMKGLSLPCHQLNVKNRFQINGTMYSVTNMEELKHEMKRVDLLCHQHKENQLHKNHIIQENEPLIAYLEVNMTQVIIGHTALMKNDVYYETYCIGINTIFASLFPFIALMFFNMRIAFALQLRFKKANSFITYLRRGRSSSNRGSDEPQTSRQDDSRRDHRLCVRFTKTSETEAFSSSKPDSMVLDGGDANAIEMAPTTTLTTENTNGTEENPFCKPEDGNITDQELLGIPEFNQSNQVRRASSGSIRLRRSNSPICRRRERRLTRISLTIVWLFLFCHIWKLVPTAYEVMYGDDHFPMWTHYIKHLSHALIVLNSSVNFLIYVML